MFKSDKFKPEKLLDVVSGICRNDKLHSQEYLRTALNRSYFSALLAAKIRLEELGEALKDSDEIHRQIIQKIKEKNSIMGDKLQELYNERLGADLDVNYNADLDIVKNTLFLSKKFNNQIKKLK